MNNDEYQANVEMLMAVCRNVQLVDTEGVLRRIGRVDAVGPVLDPTLYAAAGANMWMVADLARAAQAFKEAVRRVQCRAINDTQKRMNRG